ncbi:hypothetical protein AHFPHNDE_00861 [Pseudomonas sp. MM227]|nr:hypothetical protein AHFPHNDE_00861 [Pseudomonas sp. MM227]
MKLEMNNLGGSHKYAKRVIHIGNSSALALQD